MVIGCIERGKRIADVRGKLWGNPCERCSCGTSFTTEGTENTEVFGFSVFLGVLCGEWVS
jgi:hypothetical protein